MSSCQTRVKNSSLFCFSSVRFADNEAVQSISTSLCPESPPLQPWCPYSSLSDLPLYCLSHTFGCLPLFLLPLMLQCSTLVSNLFAAILFTCPNHRTLPRQISSHNVSVCWSWLGEKLSMCHHKWNCSWSAYMPFLEPVGGQTTVSKTYGQYNLPIIAIIIWHTHT